MDEKTAAAVRLADATARWLTAGQMKALVARKSAAMAISALVDGGPQQHPEEGPRVEDEYEMAHAEWAAAVRAYFAASPESIPSYEGIHLTPEQRQTIESMDWLAKATDGAMRM